MSSMERLDAFVGEWVMAASFPDATEGRATFEWMPGKRFLVERWGFPRSAFPGAGEDIEFGGIAIVGLDTGTEGYLQHYFDSRGVVRLYEMDVDGAEWTLTRVTPDFSPLDFAQRWIGRFGDDGDTIEGRWETSADGREWQLDFRMTYRRTAGGGQD
jgi:hypothetical protein